MYVCRNAAAELLAVVPLTAAYSAGTGWAEGVIFAEWIQVLDAGEYTGRVSFRFAPDLPPITRRAKFAVPKPSGAARVMSNDHTAAIFVVHGRWIHVASWTRGSFMYDTLTGEIR